ncbi:MAG: MFS transporter [Elusimicrobia bacterium]|nr:MFS transporter [Elusimicrobiota bacterium]
MRPDPGRKGLYPFFAATYLAEGLIGVAYLPIYYLQKDVLRLSPAQSASFTLVMTLPFLLKPLLGFLTDALPIFGRRRLPYIVLASAMASAGWAALAMLPVYTYSAALFLLSAVNVGISFADVLCDAVMVEFGKRMERTGSYQAVQIGVLYASLLASGLGGGWLAEHASYPAVFGLTACFPALILLSALRVPEEPAEGVPAQARKAVGSLGGLFASRSFWSCCLVIFLFSFNPFLGTAQFYYQSGPLKFSKVFIGLLTSLAGACGVLGAAAFWAVCNRRLRLFGREVVLDTSSLLRGCVAFGAPLTLLYWAYLGPWSAAVITAVFGVAGVFMRLALMDVVAKLSPAYGEATAFALFMAVFNLSAVASNTVGGWLYDLFARGGHEAAAVNCLAAMAALCTLACWPLLRFIPTTTDSCSAPAAAAIQEAV